MFCFSDEQKTFLDQNWDGTELCPHCDMETDFLFNPMKDHDVTCSHCGSKIKPCSLCDSSQCCDDLHCEDTIRLSLLRYNGMEVK